MVSFQLRGLVPPVFTAFKEDLSLNLAIIPEYVKYLKSKGVKGILVNGTTGEGVSMSVVERIKTAEEWLKHARPAGLHVMVQVGGTALPDVLEMARHAERNKADSILTLPDLFFKPSTVTELVDYLNMISESAPNTPLLYYHFPAMTNVNLRMEQMVIEAQKRVKTFRGLKLTSPNLEEAAAVLKVCVGETTPFLGCDTLLLASSAMGIDSSIGTTFNMFKELADSIIDGVKQPGKVSMEETARKQASLTEIVQIITEHGAWVPSMKAAMRLTSGIDVGPVRPPNKNLSQEHVAKMSKKLSAVP